jgi:hypothetical protein
VVDDELECSQITGYSECVGATKSTKRPEGWHNSFINFI